eukprot:67631-Chlamydomonas_euryale.AAC.2
MACKKHFMQPTAARLHVRLRAYVALPPPSPPHTYTAVVLMECLSVVPRFTSSPRNNVLARACFCSPIPPSLSPAHLPLLQVRKARTFPPLCSSTPLSPPACPSSYVPMCTSRYIRPPYQLLAQLGTCLLRLTAMQPPDSHATPGLPCNPRTAMQPQDCHAILGPPCSSRTAMQPQDSHATQGLYA